MLQILICRVVGLIRTAQAAWASAFEKAEQNNRLVCTDFRKFLIICTQIISLESSTPPLRTSTTVGIALSKSRKSILRINFLKFTYFMRYFRVSANTTAVG